MKAALHISILCLLLLAGSIACHAQASAASSPTDGNSPTPQKKVFLTPMCIYEGDTIPQVNLRTVYIFKPLKFKNKRQQRRYTKLVRDVKKTLPIAKEVRQIIIDTYEHLETLPTEKARKKYLDQAEKNLKRTYTPRLKKLTLSQGKLLIRLVDRETESTGYELVKAFMGSFKAGFYQTFAALFGASLKKEYDAEGDDVMTERVILMVESGQL